MTPSRIGQDPNQLADRARRRRLRIAGAFALGWVALLTLAAALAGPRFAVGVAAAAAFVALAVLIFAAARGLS